MLISLGLGSTSENTASPSPAAFSTATASAVIGDIADIARGIGVQNSAANGLAKKAVASGKVKKSADKKYTAA